MVRRSCLLMLLVSAAPLSAQGVVGIATDSAANELVGSHATIRSSPFHAINTPSAAPAIATVSASVSS